MAVSTRILTAEPQAAGAPAHGSERRLVRAAQQGDGDAFAELFRRHWPMAHRAAWLIVRDERLAEDVAQEAFLAAVAALDRFDRRRPFAPWLRVIVARRAIDAARGVAVRREVGDEALAALPGRPDVAVGPGGELLAALAGLPFEQRVVIVLRHVLGMTPGQIATALSLPRGTVNSRLRRGLDALRAAVGEPDA